jgi:hypothetical protein
MVEAGWDSTLRPASRMCSLCSSIVERHEQKQKSLNAIIAPKPQAPPYFGCCRTCCSAPADRNGLSGKCDVLTG